MEKSLASDKANNGPIIMDYFELARLHFDQKLYKEASSYYQSGIAATPKGVIPKRSGAWRCFFSQKECIFKGMRFYKS